MAVRGRGLEASTVKLARVNNAVNACSCAVKRLLINSAMVFENPSMVFENPSMIFEYPLMLFENPSMNYEWHQWLRRGAIFF